MQGLAGCKRRAARLSPFCCRSWLTARVGLRTGPDEPPGFTLERVGQLLGVIDHLPHVGAIQRFHEDLRVSKCEGQISIRSGEMLEIGNSEG